MLQTNDILQTSAREVITAEAACGPNIQTLLKNKQLKLIKRLKSQLVRGRQVGSLILNYKRSRGVELWSTVSQLVVRTELTSLTFWI